MLTTFSTPIVGYAASYHVLRPEDGARQWIDCWRGLMGVEDGSGGVKWFKHRTGRRSELVEHSNLTEAMLRCAPPDHGSREATALVEMIHKLTDAAHPQYNAEFHADVVDDNPGFWRQIGRA
jgi:hypothetical protein